MWLLVWIAVQPSRLAFAFQQPRARHRRRILELDYYRLSSNGNDSLSNNSQRRVESERTRARQKSHFWCPSIFWVPLQKLYLCRLLISLPWLELVDVQVRHDRDSFLKDFFDAGGWMVVGKSFFNRESGKRSKWDQVFVTSCFLSRMVDLRSWD